METETVQHGAEITLIDVMGAITGESDIMENQFKLMTPAALRLVGPQLIEALFIYGSRSVKVEGNIWACWKAFQDAPLGDLLENAPKACARFAATLMGIGDASC